MQQQRYEYGVIGLGTMGCNLILNMNDHGFSVAGFDKDKSKVEELVKKAENREIRGYNELSDFMNSLEKPKSIILLVPAGLVVDGVIDELKPFLEKDDLVMDFGNSHFIDTILRIEELSKEGYHFMGIGISGGEYGARNGPSIMAGGTSEDYQKVSPMLEAIAAKINNDPCVALLGPEAAGHYVKMVHNGIEYGLMQLIAEAYHLLKVIGKFNNDEIHEIFSKWNKKNLSSYLIEITADIFSKEDSLTGMRLIDMIQDDADQKGTGAWTSEEAMALQIPVPVIDMAVFMRDFSANQEERILLDRKLKGPDPDSVQYQSLVDDLEKALYFAFITTYAQGMALLHAASIEYEYHIKPEEVLRIWRGGCIIRASLVEDMRDCYRRNNDLKNIMLDEKLVEELVGTQHNIREIIKSSVEHGIPVPAFMASLSYYDTCRSKWLPANLIQAQRDFFGAHTYKRTDRGGVFHTQWASQ
jgi:6-phosphogluconate dehydrogenase